MAGTTVGPAGGVVGTAGAGDKDGYGVVGEAAPGLLLAAEPGVITAVGGTVVGVGVGGTGSRGSAEAVVPAKPGTPIAPRASHAASTRQARAVFTIRLGPPA
ncbi:hypothetical protein MBOT_11510 [Mycobacterium botniense]|uniref:Uncharacterized protein n=1 Tax=Mycobacterium botniense TaxID=84962 RepID=A0A7I9XVH8_9MYCO|nr:hypothetical protein MBOT_11510 [Mycobacterium botniense]